MTQTDTNTPTITSEVALVQVASSLVSAVEAFQRLGNNSSKAGPSTSHRRGFSRVDAAHYIGISPTTFDSMIKEGLMPKPVRFRTRTIWDRKALDSAFDAMIEPSDENPWDAWE
jgi:predicted DNA-binding transcriptional regulator AlpA